MKDIDIDSESEKPSEQGEREGEAPSGFAGGGGDVSPYDRRFYA